jgi:uncharacterized protein YecE (DUF72 family)
LIYRSGVKYAAGDYLPEYAKRFNTVKVDQWFWSLFPAGIRLPDPETAKEYAQSVPDDFVFTVSDDESSPFPTEVSSSDF